MDRATWIRDLRRRNAEQEAGLVDDFDRYWGEIEDTHRSFVERFLARLPTGGRVLDAACGTGKYARMVLDSGRTPLCVDHTQAYLEKVSEKAPGVQTAVRDLQELPFEGEFDGVMCVDAMEFVPPEDWPVVLERFRRALRRGGWLYLTVELVAEGYLVLADNREDGACCDSRALGWVPAESIAAEVLMRLSGSTAATPDLEPDARGLLWQP